MYSTQFLIILSLAITFGMGAYTFKMFADYRHRQAVKRCKNIMVKNNALKHEIRQLKTQLWNVQDENYQLRLSIDKCEMCIRKNASGNKLFKIGIYEKRGER